MRFSISTLLIVFVNSVLIAASPVERRKRRNATCKKTKVAILLGFQLCHNRYYLIDYHT